jgi:predicted DNA-binding transcriptional regulator AlpA
MEIKAVSQPALLRTANAATMTGLSISTLNKLRCAGGGPPFLKLGRAVRYARNDVEDWLASRRVHSTSETIRSSPD